jgi:acetoin utilization deacetylase AcuC-like enzyme
MPLAMISHHECFLHEAGHEHPECPERLSVIQDALVASGLELVLRHHDAPLASREQLLRVHDPAYLDFIWGSAPEEGFAWVDGDTAMSPHTLRAALRAAGAATLGVDLVLRGGSPAAFCCVRPPGHHAERARTMGFCIFNSVAVAAAHAMHEYGLQRVAILDFDVHHGNGTEDIFRDDPRVLFGSTFQHPFYPFRGADSASERILNVPLPAGTDGRAFRAAVESHWLGPLDAFRPELVLISAGFDAHRLDEIAHFRLVERDFAWVTERLREVADAHAGGRVVSVLEGGYALSALGRSVRAHLDALLGNAAGR